MTAAALRSVPPPTRTVEATSRLFARGWTTDGIRAQIAARRWQRFGRAILLHNANPDANERRAVALINCAEHAVLTSFTALEIAGLKGWERDISHVLVIAGTRVRRIAAAPVRIHWCADATRLHPLPGRRVQRSAPALVIAASSFGNARPGCGILAAGVQQGLVTAGALRDALEWAPRTRHRRLFGLAIDDIDQGAHALSEIDLGALCARNGLPRPVRQAVRIEPSGRRRYVDAEWRLPDGRRVVAEIDGALHLAPTHWWRDSLRHNELVIAGDAVLRFPTVVLRSEEPTVADQLRRALG